MKTNQPRLSIGMPVYNAERYLEQALDSILAQTYTDFEIIISDNASTDRTAEICRSYAEKDSRIRYFCNEVNLGAAPNFNRTFELARGEYFKWAAYDDLHDPDFVQECISVLDNDSSIVLCHSLTRTIDENGKVLSTEDGYQKIRLGSPEPRERFSDLIRLPHPCVIVFGIMRSSVLRQTQKIASYAGSDRMLLAHLGLFGKLHQVPRILFSQRQHPETTWSLYGNDAERIAWFDSSKKRSISLPNWRLQYEYVSYVGRGGLSAQEQAVCYLEWLKTLRGTWRQYSWWRWLLQDLELASVQVAGRAEEAYPLAGMAGVEKKTRRVWDGIQQALRREPAGN